MSVNKICSRCLPLIRNYPPDRIFSTCYSTDMVERCFGRLIGRSDMPDIIPYDIKTIIRDASIRKHIVCGNGDLRLIRTTDKRCTDYLASLKKETTCLADIWAGKSVSNYDTIVNSMKIDWTSSGR